MIAVHAKNSLFGSKFRATIIPDLPIGKYALRVIRPCLIGIFAIYPCGLNMSTYWDNYYVEDLGLIYLSKVHFPI